MKWAVNPTLAIALLALAMPATAAPDWSRVDQVLGRPGTEQGHDVRRYSFPRSDLAVTLDGVKIAPALALGSWLAFQERGEDAVVMGDLVLTHDEVNPVLSRLLEGGLTISALHDHQVGARAQPYAAGRALGRSGRRTGGF